MSRGLELTQGIGTNVQDDYIEVKDKRDLVFVKYFVFLTIFTTDPTQEN